MAWSSRSPEARGYGAAWRKLRKVILRRDRGLCQPCLRAGRTTVATEVNHIRPKAQGGTDDEDNLEAICAPCHRRQTAQQKGHRIRQQIAPDGWPTGGVS